MYVKFFRWATDRLGDRDGIVCFVSNNSFVDQHAFDGMRKHLAKDFDQILHLDLHGNVRRNPKLSGTTHNVFGIQVGVGITLAVKKRGIERKMLYFRVPELWRRREKLEFLANNSVAWQTITPDARHSWIVPENADEYDSFLALLRFSGCTPAALKPIATRWSTIGIARSWLCACKIFYCGYNAEVYRHKSDPGADWPDNLKWSRDLKQDALRGRLAEFSDAKLRASLYRPFSKKWLLFDRVLNEEVYQWPKISGQVIAVPGIGNRKNLELSFPIRFCRSILHLKRSNVSLSLT